MDQKKQVLAWLEEHKSDLQKLLSELIQIPSYSGEEWRVQQFVKACAEAEGLEAEARAFDEEGKRPCVLMTYKGTLNDVFTLAHELGHSMHSYYSKITQPYIYSDYKIFVAEVASTTNEILLFEHLLSQSSDPRFRAYLYAHIADEIRGTIYRQTMFAEFELFMHETVEQGTPLTADLLNKKYYELNKLYYGPAVDPLKDIELEWARIPHFHYNFYVYKYATGMSAALKLARNLRSGKPELREAYLGFLKAGCSKDVLDIMKDAGVDLSTPEPVTAALDYFSEAVECLEKELRLCGEI